MNPNLIAMLAGSALLVVSCASSTNGDKPPKPPKPGADPASPAGPLPLPVNPEAGSPLRAKPSFVNAQQLSDQVKVGMPQRTIEAMFGPPDKAGYRDYGAQTGTPWRALVWEWVFDDVQPARALSIVFQEVNGQWLVNHGDWPD